MVAVDMAAVDMAAVVDTSEEAVVDTSAVDTLWPRQSHLDTSRLHTLHPDMLWSDLDPVRTSRLGIEAMNTSRVDTAAISGTAVGGITALARAGYGRTFTASTCGRAIKVLQSRRRSGARSGPRHLPTSDRWLAGFPRRDQVCPTMRTPKEAGEVSC
jgi:hypothetical protein